MTLVNGPRHLAVLDCGRARLWVSGCVPRSIQCALRASKYRYLLALPCLLACVTGTCTKLSPLPKADDLCRRLKRSPCPLSPLWSCHSVHARRTHAPRRSGVLGVDSEPLAMMFLSEDARPKVKYPGSARFQHNPERIAAATRPDIAAKLARPFPCGVRRELYTPMPPGERRLPPRGAISIPVPSSFGGGGLGGKFSKSDQTEKIVKQVPSERNPELVGRETHDDNIYGAPTAVMHAHKAWGINGSALTLHNWIERPGFGKVPEYLSQQRMRAAAEDRQGSMESLHVLPQHKSESTMRATEHPLQWKKMRRAASASVLRPDRPIRPPSDSAGMTKSQSSLSLCCTYGLHPHFPRTMSAPEVRLPRAGSAPLRRPPSGFEVANEEGRRPTWRGVARPYPQDCRGTSPKNAA